MLAYLARYTHRVAISNSRLLKADAAGVTFRVKNYRVDGRARHTTMTLDVAEFIRRFLLHVLPKAFTASATTACLPTGTRAEISTERASCSMRLPRASTPVTTSDCNDSAGAELPPCPCCGSRLRIIERFSAASPRRIVHHRTNSSSGSIAHDRQRMLPPRLPRAALAGSRLERPLPVLGERGPYRSDAAPIILPRARSASCPLAAERTVALTRTIPRACPKSKSPSRLAGLSQHTFPRVPSPQASRRRPMRLW